MEKKHKGIYERYGKRGLDIFLSFVSIVLLSPILLITALFVRIKLGSPVLFRQARPGKNERIFQLYKFRSMTNEMDDSGKLLPDSKRLTKFGKFLRVSSLDELPELINIFKGDMSIVGPRPLSIYYLPHYSLMQRERHKVRPGLTGLAQINGRNNLDWDNRFEIDVNYVKSISFINDLKIVLGTVFKVIKHSDIVVRGGNAIKDFGPYCVLKEESEINQKMSSMTYSEIGSHYWMEELNQNRKPIEWLPKVKDSSFTFSGRSAIEIALIDILHNTNVNRVYVPSYCCISMLQSFIDKNLKIEFYDVDLLDKHFKYQYPPKIEPNSIALVMSYFGDNTKAADELIRYFHEKDVIVIEDITHSMFSDYSTARFSDYLVISLRKWFPIPTGGWVGKSNGFLIRKPDLESNHAVKDKIEAMKKKAEFINGYLDNKENFLLQNAKFENDLIHVDRMLQIDDTSMSILEAIDIKSVIKNRKNNCKVLLEKLKDLDGNALILPEIDLEHITPLFLPVFMKSENRDSLRSFLIEKGIYCPVHWPEVMGAKLGARANELSLICDQRYTENDMKVIAEEIHWWVNNQE